MQSINPATGKIIASYPALTNNRAEEIIAKSSTAFNSWKKTSFEKRDKLMFNLANVLENNKEKYAKIITTEMGKTLKSAVAEIEKCTLACKFYAENSAQFLADELIDKNNQSTSLITYQPLGTIFGIMPWNFPFWQAFRFICPTLMAGNCAIIKHSSNVCGSALAIKEALNLAGFPENVFEVLLISASQVENVIQNKNIKAVTLTGSVEAGRSVAGLAGKYLKKSVLELGGSDPYIILGDANLELATTKCVQSRLINAGQSCISAKRFIVVEEIYQQFIQLFLEKMQKIKMGDPLDSENDIGPQASRDLRDQLHQQVQDSIKLGAKCILGGKIPQNNGAYYPPSILIDVQENMPAYHQEMFGPVAAIIKAKDENDAIRIANDSHFGLGSAIFTTNIKNGEEIAKTQIEAGICFVNDFVKSDPKLPFGGIKESGYGRELSYFGIKEFVNVKSVVVSNR